MNAICSCFAAWSTWCTLWAITSALVFILAALHFARKWLLRKFEWLKTFYVWIGVLAVLGGAWAFLFPLAINADFSKNGDGAALRQMLIYTTGGVLGVITLGENHRKNSLEKVKNDQDHIRQVYAERRSRYTTAIEQLSNDKASIRLGGVYTLLGLVDEWLADEKTIPDIEERHKEGQVIINNLCAYIRSPFLLAERAEQLDGPYAKDLQVDFGGDKEKFDANKRAFSRDKAALEEERQIRQSIIKEISERLRDIDTPGSWSKFDYDFSNAHFFYFTPFTFSHFDAFSHFHGATFTQGASFFWATFTKDANFFRATFTQNANFSEAKFAQNANFSGAKFTGYANFSKAKFAQNANFSEAKFTGYANLSATTFTQNANFSEATFKEKPIFEDTLNNQSLKAKFSNKVKPESYNFEVSHNSPYKIETWDPKRNGIKFTIPKGAELFDPDRKATVTVNHYIYTQNDRLNFIATKKNR